MDFKENYYFEKYEQLAVLADTQKCKTILSRNTDTNEIVVFKVMDKVWMCTTDLKIWIIATLLM